MSEQGVRRIALFGAAPDTPNMGVSALFASAISGLGRIRRPIEFVVFDNGLGRRTRPFRSAGLEFDITLFGARGGKRFHRPENLATMALLSRLGAAGARLNPALRLIDSCDAVLDVSGGDSFSDIYGRARFDAIHRPKAIALSRGKPLILLPQTYGPYRDPAVRAAAADVTRGARMAWARDPDSYVALQDLLGAEFDPARHRCGVDMAFGLEPVAAPDLLDRRLLAWLQQRSPDTPVVGFNVSGLIYNSPDGGVGAFGLKSNYRDTVEAFLRRLLETSNVKLVLVSHVMDRPGHYESDQGACLAVMQRLGERFQDRVALSPIELDQSQVKWLIAQLDWFCGTRMHSTIAALSSAVPTAAVSYSDKTRGVFRTCAQEDNVLDPRRLEGPELVERLLATFQAREAARSTLRRALPQVMSTLREQFECIAQAIDQLGAPAVEPRLPAGRAAAGARGA